MTLFGRDASNFDGAISYAGLGYFTHKSTEGTSISHDQYGSRLNAARAAGVPVLGSYHVVRTPGNGGAGSLAQQLSYWLAYMDAHTPWWRTWPHWMMQVDAEKWSYDAVSAATVKAFAGLLVASGAPGYKVTYASRGQYGDSLSGIATDLWNADYRGSVSGSYPGDGWVKAGALVAGWAPYSGKMPRFLQYTSRPFDEDAFRGTLAELLALTGPAGAAPLGDTMAFTPQQEADIAFTLLDGGNKWAMHYRIQRLESLLTAIASKVDITPEELTQIGAAAAAGVAGQAGAFADAVVAKLPAGALTKADVVQAVHDAFAGGLAPTAQ